MWPFDTNDTINSSQYDMFNSISLLYFKFPQLKIDTFWCYIKKIFTTTCLLMRYGPPSPLLNRKYLNLGNENLK